MLLGDENSFFLAESFVLWALRPKTHFLLFLVLIYLWFSVKLSFFCRERFWTGFCTELEICLLPNPVSHSDLVSCNLMSILHTQRFGVFLFVTNLWSFPLLVVHHIFVFISDSVKNYFYPVFCYLHLAVTLFWFILVTLLFMFPSVLTFNDFNWSLYSEHSAVIVLGSMSIIFLAEYFTEFSVISYWSCSPGVFFPTLYHQLIFLS